MNKNQVSLGIVIMIAGAVILLGKLGVFSFIGQMLWPLFILIPGLIFHALYFYRVLPSGVLVPGGILVTNAILFFLCNIIGWSAMSYLWPVFILGVAVGLYEYYIFDRSHPRGAFITALILAIIAAVFFGFIVLFSVGVYFLAVVLILIGVFMLMRRPYR